MVLLFAVSCSEVGADGSGAGGESQIESIGPDRGTVEQGQVRVDIPSGALDGPVDIGIAIETTAPVRPPTNLALDGNVVVLTPHGQIFKKAVTVTMPAVDPNGTLYRLDGPGDDTWDEVPDANRTDGTVQFETGRFSYYAWLRGGPRYLDHEIVLAGDRPVQSSYVAHGGPLANDGYVYWSPGDSTIRRAALVPNSTIETLYSQPDEAVSLHGVGDGTVVFGSPQGGMARMNLDGSGLIDPWAGSAFPDYWLVASGYVWAGSSRVALATGVSESVPEALDSYVNGSCVPNKERTRCLDFVRELDFTNETYLDFALPVGGGAANIGGHASNTTHWFLLDGESSSEGDANLMRIPHGGGQSETLLVTTEGTVYKRVAANDAHAYMITDNCHRMAYVNLADPTDSAEGEVLLNFNGPCLIWLHIDDTYAYFDTPDGLVRSALSDLRDVLAP